MHVEDPHMRTVTPSRKHEMSLIVIVHHTQIALTTFARGMISYPHHPSHIPTGTGESYRVGDTIVVHDEPCRLGVPRWPASTDVLR